jgi:divalent metal cation (Fe/Co/Zn/Cd) transporter
VSGFNAPAPSLTRYAWLSIGAAVISITLKFAAYFVTGSVGLLSDALESIVNLVAVVRWAWTVQTGHELLEEVEHAIIAELGNVTVMTHLEPIEDPVSLEDIGLDRPLHPR